MKKKVFGGVMLLVAAMVFSVGGTCFAQPFATVDPTFSGTTRLVYGPVYSHASDRRAGIGTGATAYGVIGDPWRMNPATTVSPVGATPFAVARDIMNVPGTELNLVWMPDRDPTGRAYGLDFSGSTPTGSPALISGASSAFVVSVQAAAGTQVANFEAANNARTGVTVMMIDGARMTHNWRRGIPEAPTATAWELWDRANPYFATELTVWKPRERTRLDDTGVTIYGTTGAAVGSGASIWALTNWGAPAGGGAWSVAQGGRGTTAWPVTSSSYSFTGSNQRIAVKDAAGNNLGTVSAVSGFVGSPVISGNSIFLVGYGGAGTHTGLTVYQLDKDRLHEGVINAATIKVADAAVPMRWNERFIPTPVVSGGSLFVVCNRGGVTVYDTQDLEFGLGRTQGFLGNILLPAPYDSGVTASPVTYSTGTARDPYIIMPGSSAVTAFRLSDLSDGADPQRRQWWYNFEELGVGHQIWGTPAVAAKYVFVPVVTNVGTGRVYAFRIDGDPNIPGRPGEQQWVREFRLNSPAVASPIVVHRDMWAFSYGSGAAENARAYRFDARDQLRSSSMRAHKWWTQFKFDAEKTGDATVRISKDEWHDDDSGCFLSTIR